MPAELRDIFRDTLIAKKYDEGEVRTHDLLAGKQKEIKHQHGLERMTSCLPGRRTIHWATVTKIWSDKVEFWQNL